MIIRFLGSTSGTPSAGRGLPGIVVQRPGEVIVLDCGEGFQHRFLGSGVGLNRPLKVFITHLHGDHVYGLPALLYSMSILGREAPVYVYGPRGIRGYLEASLEAGGSGLAFPLRVEEVGPGLVLDAGDYRVEAVEVDHSVPGLAYSIRERDRPGKFDVRRAEELGIPLGPLRKELQMGRAVRLGDGRVVAPEEVLGPPVRGLHLVYTGDTRPSEKVVRLASGCDILIHDSTFTSDLAGEAAEAGHSTAAEAAEVARRARARALILYHFSPRYRDLTPLLREARAVFRRTYLGVDGLRIDVGRAGGCLVLRFTGP